MRLVKASRCIVFVVAGMILSTSMSDRVAANRTTDQAKEITDSPFHVTQCFYLRFFRHTSFPND